MIDPVRRISLDDIEQARGRIASTVLRTPLVRLDLGKDGPDIRLKLENLQPTNAYKIRGATNAVANLSDEQRARGVWTISAGNAGQGVAYAARKFGIAATVVAIETAPQTKLDRMRALGAAIVPVSYDDAWKAAESHTFPGLEGTFIHPFDNHDFIAGHATMGLEILEDAPDVHTVITAIGGGGLITGVGSAIKAKRPDVPVLGAEPETAAPYALSLRDGGPRKFAEWQASFVDGAGGKSVTERMWQRMRPVTNGSITVTLDQTREAMWLIAEKTRTIAEGAGALALAAALTGEAGEGPIVCVVSGGNIDLGKFAELVVT
ncbi:pyridoxal-phosphate dependent enzyme [Sphingomonas sediminicola]|jgi:threonine dehydratase|uniref:Pyridoxal-phosphate dependent enzyme n=1 Tax=Sphingomonas sediminicola TaxID=386874 RepID=A0ABX6T877_9SPHN|nr:pyridoxal-phosphate dependent enzyme [Sphingomonas sediminicola]QNP46046.1 pyridoxal-phosphate dependent enzyme [Sphingomonas sediminicola]